MRALREKRLDKVVLEAANADKPVLCICVGMQLLFDGSSEFGDYEGLGMIPGKVDVFGSNTTAKENLRLPNVSWLPIKKVEELNGSAQALFDDVPENSKFYFIHSYHADADNPHTMATSEYEGLPFAAVVAKGSVIATQFHPEKSGPDGLRLLKNFVS